MPDLISSFYDAFKAAHDATETLPILIAERDDAKAKAEAELNAHLATISQLEAAQAELDHIKSTLAEREVALADATKSRDEMSRVVDIIRGTLPVLPQPVVEAPIAATDATGNADGPNNTQQAQPGPNELDLGHSESGFIHSAETTPGETATSPDVAISDAAPNTSITPDPAVMDQGDSGFTALPEPDSVSHTDSQSTTANTMPVGHTTDAGAGSNPEPWRNWKPDGDYQFSH